MSDDGKKKTARFDYWARICGLVVAVGSLAGFTYLADRAYQHEDFVDRIFVWSFTFFAVGLAELFALFLGLAIMGRIDLPKVFQDKPVEPARELEPEPAEEGEKKKAPSVSLSRLQAFMWTLVVMTSYFHAAVKHSGEGLPAIPSELLLVMGISSAVYLTSKQMTKPSAPPGDGSGQ